MEKQLAEDGFGVRRRVLPLRIHVQHLALGIDDLHGSGELVPSRFPA